MPVMRRLTPVSPPRSSPPRSPFPPSPAPDIIEIGKADPPAAPSCPTRPCLAVSRTTGYQAKVGATRGLMTIPADGRIVAWTIALGKPGKKQTAFFDSKLGGPASAQITVLNPRRKLRSRAVGHGELQKLAPYFGTTVQFPLKATIPVKKGGVVALSVPTWAPALASACPATRRGGRAAARASARTRAPRPRRWAPTSSRSTSACTAPRA